jgi:hypothetical protein
MANTKTALGKIPVILRSGNPSGIIQPYVVTLDTAADFDLHTPASNNFVAVMGLLVAEATAGTLTFKSGTAPTTLVALEMAANYNLIHRIDRPLLLTANPGEKLTILGSAAVTSMIIYLMECSRLSLESL